MVCRHQSNFFNTPKKNKTWTGIFTAQYTMKTERTKGTDFESEKVYNGPLG